MQYPVTNEVLDISSVRVTGAECLHVCGFLIITHPLQDSFVREELLWTEIFLIIFCIIKFTITAQIYEYLMQFYIFSLSIKFSLGFQGKPYVLFSDTHTYNMFTTVPCLKFGLIKYMHCFAAVTA
jgi:uncharacterized membrane protein